MITLAKLQINKQEFYFTFWHYKNFRLLLNKGVQRFELIGSEQQVPPYNSNNSFMKNKPAKTLTGWRLIYSFTLFPWRNAISVVVRTKPDRWISGGLNRHGKVFTVLSFVQKPYQDIFELSPSVSEKAGHNLNMYQNTDRSCNHNVTTMHSNYTNPNVKQLEWQCQRSNGVNVLAA